MGNSAADYYTALRSDEEKKYSSALVALGVNTGKPRWVFQTVHNDVWDYDLGSQPTLIEFPTASGKVPAILLPTKSGDMFVLSQHRRAPAWCDWRRAAAAPGAATASSPQSRYRDARTERERPSGACNESADA